MNEIKREKTNQERVNSFVYKDKINLDDKKEEENVKIRKDRKNL